MRAALHEVGCTSVRPLAHRPGTGSAALLFLCILAAACEPRQPPAPQAKPAEIPRALPAPLPPAPAAVNRTLPAFTPPSPGFALSEWPTDEEIFRARLFEEPLVPAAWIPVNRDENHALARALLAFRSREVADEAVALEQFLATHPDSRWRLSLLANLGRFYGQSGRWTKALATWDQAWQFGKDRPGPRARALTDGAVAELAALSARLGDFERLDRLLSQLGSRQLAGSATEKLSAARLLHGRMRDQPETAFRCGLVALGHLIPSTTQSPAWAQILGRTVAGTNGLNLAQLDALAEELSLSLQMARRRPGAPILLPTIVHWNVGHWSVLVGESQGRCQVEDPAFAQETWLSRAALDAEASGYCLVARGSLPDGWQTVSVEEARTVWGRGSAGAHRDISPDCDGKGGAPISDPARCGSISTPAGPEAGAPGAASKCARVQETTP